MVNLLQNPSFEQPIPDGDTAHKCVVFTPDPNAGQDMYITFRGEVNNPVGWQSWYIHDGRPPTHDPTNVNGWSEPEVRQALHDGRQHEGDVGHLMFTFYRIHDGGYYQTVNVTPGQKVRASYFAHAWSSSDDDPLSSEWVGRGAYYALEGDPNNQATFWVGVDPMGGTNPLSPNVVWSKGAHIYNAFAQLPSVEVEAQSDAVTFFTRQRFLWPLKHNDGYIDSASLEVVAEPVQPDDMIPARVPYKRTYLLLHPGADGAWINAVVDSGAWDARRITIGGSADDAGMGLRDYRTVLAVNPDAWPSDLNAFFDTWYPGIDYTPIYADTPDELQAWLEQWLNPTPPPNGGSPSGLAPGLHLTTGDSGASEYYQRLRFDLPDDVVPPSVKAYGTPQTMATLKLFKDIDSRILTVGRLSQGLNGEAVEGADLSGDLALEAERIMNISMSAWESHRDYVDVWEILNEQDPVGPDGHRRMAIFFMHCMDIANAHGYTIALFSYSLGVPEYNEIQTIHDTGCLAQAKRDGHYISLHEYADPLNKDYGTSIPGTDPNPERGPLATRYRYWKDVAGDELPNILLTEVNVARDLSTISDEDWDDQIRWYMTEVNKDPYVKAVHLYGWGSVGGAWQDFDIQYNNLDEIWYRMVLDYATPSDPTPPTHNITPYSQRDPRWSDDRMGQSSYTVGGAGCAMTAACMIATQIEPTLDPGELNAWLSANNGYTSGGLLMWSRVADRVDGMSFDNYYRWDGEPADLDIVHRILDTKPCIIKVDFYPGGTIQSHFVVALYAQNNDLRILDPWDGQEKWLLDTYGEPDATLSNSILRLAEYSIEEQPLPPPQTLIGFNDHNGVNGTGAQWMKDNGKRGLVVQPVFLGGTPQTFDYSMYNHYTIVNLRYSWSVDLGGAGTIPQPYTDAWNDFVNASAQTINQSVGVDAWELFNEMNNPREWPKETLLTPQHVVDTYNAIRRKVDPFKRVMSPGALDPFNAVAGDPRTWLTHIYSGVDGAELVTAHGYIRGPNPSLVGSEAKFTNDPLRWQYLNYYLCINALLDVLPASYANHPVYITEFNHLYKTVEGDWGWVNDQRAYDVVIAAYAQAKAQRYAGLALYRWSGDQWIIDNNNYIKRAVLDAT